MNNFLIKNKIKIKEVIYHLSLEDETIEHKIKSYKIKFEKYKFLLENALSYYCKDEDYIKYFGKI